MPESFANTPPRYFGSDQFTAFEKSSGNVLIRSLLMELYSTLPNDPLLDGLLPAIEETLVNLLTLAVPFGLSETQIAAAQKELVELWRTALTKENFAGITGSYARGIAVDAFVDKVAHMSGDVVASLVAKKTTNTFLIEFARSSTELVIVDAYAARAGWHAVMVKNASMILQAGTGLFKDSMKVAASIRAYELQVGSAVDRALAERDPARRTRLLKVGMDAITSLNALRNEHPVISVMSNVSVIGTIDELKWWNPF